MGQAGCVRATGRGADRSAARTDPVNTAARVPAITQTSPDPSGADTSTAPIECATAATRVDAPLVPTTAPTPTEAATLRWGGVEVHGVEVQGVEVVVMGFLRVVVFEVQERPPRRLLHFSRKKSHDARRVPELGYVTAGWIRSTRRSAVPPSDEQMSRC